MKINYKIIIIFSFLALLASSCPEENSELVTPPSFSKTVNIRFLNLNKNSEYSLAFDDVKVASLTTLYQMSNSFNPDNDSAFVSLYSNSNKINELSRVTFFWLPIYSISASYSDVLLNT